MKEAFSKRASQPIALHRLARSAAVVAVAALGLVLTVLPALARPVDPVNPDQAAFAKRLVAASVRQDSAALVAMMAFPVEWTDGCRKEILRTPAQARQGIAAMNRSSFRQFLANSARHPSHLAADNASKTFGIGQGVIWARGTRKGKIGIQFWQSRSRDEVIAAGEPCRAVACQTRKHWLTVDLTKKGPLLRMGKRGSPRVEFTAPGVEKYDGGSACAYSVYVFSGKARWRVVAEGQCDATPGLVAKLYDGVPEASATTNEWLDFVMATPAQDCRPMPAQTPSRRPK